MSRNLRFAMVLTVVAVLAACVVATFASGAFAQTEMRRGEPTKSTATAPPLPLGQASTRAKSSLTQQIGVPDLARLYPNSLPQHVTKIQAAPLPGGIPRLSDALKRINASGRRHAMSATGATVSLTGDQYSYYLNDETLPYNADVYWLCQNMTPNAYYRYVIFAPNTAQLVPNVGGPDVGGTVFQASATGACESGGGAYYYAQENLATPVGTGTDPAYPSVWAVAVQRGTYAGGTFTPVQYDAVAYTVVISTLNFTTYSDSGYSVQQNQFTPGQTIYFGANGLTPNHQYAFGVVYTAGSGQPCLYTLPGAAQNSNDATCFTTGVPTGVTPFGGVVQGSYAIPTNASTGTYQLELYDATTQDLVSEQQVSVQPSSTTITLTPISGATVGTNIGNTFATDGLFDSNGAFVAEQSTTGVNITVNPVVSGHKYSLVLSTPNGVVQTQTETTNQVFGPPTSVTATGTTLTYAGFNWPLNVGNFTGIGPTLTSFAPNVMTLQVYDQTAATVIGSQSFDVLAYAASTQWTSPGAAAETVLVTTPTTETVQVSNVAGANYGTWNGDGIKQIVLAPDAANDIKLSLSGTTATDSSSQTWNLTTTGGTIVATPAVSTQFLPVGGTINIPVGVAVAAAGDCVSTYCTLRTAITPYHGITQSAYDVPTNGLEVFGPGGSVASGSPTYQWQVGAESAGLPAPRFTQMMYDHGTQGVVTGTWNVKINIDNCGATENLQEVEFTLPTSFDAAVAGQAPTLSGVTVNGAAQTWTMYTKGSAGQRATNLTSNQFAIGYTGTGDNTKNGGGIPFPTVAQPCPLNAAKYSAVVTLAFPIPLLTFPFQEIQANADYQGGCASSTTCGMTEYNLGPLAQLTNPVSGTPANIDSTELAIYSLDGSLMTALFNPSTVAQGIATTSQFQFKNTPTAADPNPDYVDELVLTMPTGVAPTSITPPTNWYQNSVTTGGGNTVYTFSVCSAAVPPCNVNAPTFPGGDEPNALAPGATINFTFNWTTANLPAVGTYTVNWVAYGANGGAHTATEATTILFANTTAQVSFLDAGGGNGTPSGTMTSVLSGSQATVGSDYSPTFGNGFVLQLYNNGSQTITSATINVPAEDVLDYKPQDTTHDWQVANVYVYPGSGGTGCSGTVAAGNITEPINSSGTAGSIKLTGCTLAPGSTMKVFFTSQAPYDQPNHFYRFNGTVSSAVTTNASTQTAYTNSDTLLVISDAQLQVYIPATGGTTINNGQGTGGTYNVTCTGCAYTQSPQLIDLGTFAGTFTANDVINAAVQSDTQGGHGWQLYVDLNALPTGGTLVSEVDNTAGVVSTSPYYTNNLTTYTTVPTSSPGQLLSTFTGQTAAASYSHTPIQNLMNFQVQLPSYPTALTPGVNTVTLTYTLIPN